MLPSEAGIWTPDFWTIFLPLIWIFMEGEGDEIKYRQSSKRVRTLNQYIIQKNLHCASVESAAAASIFNLTD